ncbi:MAG: hypothetical protein RLZZ272_1285 [Actinomycetota bacterium]
MIDAVRRDAAAGYPSALAAPRADAAERDVVSAQLGRPARGRPAVVHRCAHGLPTVVRVDPRLEDGTPFPTLFWLTCPRLRSEVGRLEADREMRRLGERLADEPELAEAYASAAQRYVAARDGLGRPLDGGPGAGGMPDRVKCLHVHVAHELATGDNPIGRLALERILPMACPEPCVRADATGGLAHGTSA